MKIVVCGAGRVGSSLVENLAEQPDIELSVIDPDADRLNALRSHLDISTFQGSITSPAILEQADVGHADILIALTSSDAMNLMCCSLAYHVFGSPSQLARVTDSSLQAFKHSDEDEGNRSLKNIIPHTTTIAHPTQDVANYIKGLIAYPSLLQISNFSSGKVVLFSTKISDTTTLLNQTISSLYERLKTLDKKEDEEALKEEPHECSVVAIYRHGGFLKPRAWSLLEFGDEVFFMVRQEHFHALTRLIHPHERPHKNLFIKGSGLIAQSLARSTEGQYRVKLIEPDLKKCQDLASKLTSVSVIQGEMTQTKLLQEEGIEHVDLFCALGAEDEENMIACMQARALGAKRSLAIIQNTQYYDMIERYNLPIDTPLSTRLISLSSILSYINKDSKIRRIHSLRNAQSEAVEAQIGERSPLIGKRMDEARLPHDAVIGAISRRTDEGRKVLIAKDEHLFYANDRIIFFLNDFSKLNAVVNYITDTS